jgi:hypothetical protein
MPWDWRILLNGKGDELLYERRLIATGGLPFAELKRRSRINERAHVADKDPNFSRLVRQGIPGFGSEWISKSLSPKANIHPNGQR